MESRTYLKNIRITPKKLRMLSHAIRKMSPVESLERLRLSGDKASRVLFKAVKSAVTNARITLKVADNLLQWKTLAIDEGMKMKRFRAGARGMARPVVKKYSHINIVIISKEITHSK